MKSKKIFTYILCCTMLMTGFNKVNAVGPETITIVADVANFINVIRRAGEIIKLVVDGIEFIFDKSGKIHNVASNNKEIQKYIEEKEKYGGIRNLQDAQRKLLEIRDGKSNPPIYGQSQGKQQCIAAVSGCLGRINSPSMDKKGNVIYIIGPSGTGKTTMANAIANVFLKHSEKTRCFITPGQIVRDKELGTQLFKTVTRPANLCTKKGPIGFWEGVNYVIGSAPPSDPMSTMGTYDITVAAPILSHILKWDGNVVIIIDDFDKMKQQCSTHSFDGDIVEDKSADEILKSISSNGFYMVGDTKVDCSNLLIIVTSNESRNELEQNFGQGGIAGGGAQRLNIIEFERLDDNSSRCIINKLSNDLRKTLTMSTGEFKLKSIIFSDQTLENMGQYIRNNETKQGRAKDDLWDQVLSLCVSNLNQLQNQHVELIFNENNGFSYRIIENTSEIDNTIRSNSNTPSLGFANFSNYNDGIHIFLESNSLINYSSSQ